MNDKKIVVRLEEDIYLDRPEMITFRFGQVLTALGGNMTEIAEKYKVKYSTLTKWSYGQRMPNATKLKNIFGVNPDFIEKGIGPMFLEEASTSKEEQKQLESNAELVESPKKQDVEIEFISIPLNAGLGYTFSDIPIAIVRDVKATYKSSYKQARVSGDSMYPAIPNGWRVTFDTNLTPTHDDVVVATANGVWVVKRFKIINGQKTLVSDNQQYDKYNFNGGDDVVIHGVVIEISKY